MRPLFKRIWERYPESRDFAPCECGVTLAVVPIDTVKRHQFVILDEEFKLKALALIRDHHLPQGNYADGVLVITERA